MGKINLKGFTLIELLVIISIIGFLTVAALFSFNIVRMHSRDAIRVGNVATLNRALAMYMNDQGSYPIASGECLKAASGSGKDLLDSDVIVDVPLDPLWPTTVPTSVNEDGYAEGAASNFCYYYMGTNKNYYISYYLESNSKSGSAGIHVTAPAGAQN
ncbi:MAG: type II secretion system protein [Patescibacteria group bacterium]|nr:type II secretion system protein [Patescibacteria group bacterium]MDD5554859.1 type II secretion system protein [Patescibacteria group bacterium]